MPSDKSRDTASPWLVLAHLLRPQGRRGEVLADLMTDFPERFAEDARVYLAKPNFSGPADDARLVTISNHWLPVGRNHGRIVLHITGTDSIEQAEMLAGLDVLVPAEERLPLDDDAEYISDLIDCNVFDHGALVGAVSAVDFPTTADGARRLPDAAPLLTVVTPEGDEILIPYVQSFLLSTDVASRRINMELPQGLLDLNRPGPSA